MIISILLYFWRYAEGRKAARILQEIIELESAAPGTIVQVDLYLAGGISLPGGEAADLEQMSLLLINDGQDMEEWDWRICWTTFMNGRLIKPLFCAAASMRDHDRSGIWNGGCYPITRGRGARAAAYTPSVYWRGDPGHPGRGFPALPSGIKSRPLRVFRSAP